ncbi:hypothetical protein [Humibacillus sp. DSM 29435]|uniref:hypothetical protein n=1 Tax=Humibacillus sp. DSM 29435 TaxID=1869167 RepID=UPI00158698B5|nr:hypothetical protein [Humibacillus sp. DSM 29435]
MLAILVDASVAGSSAGAPAWCVKLVGHHENDWPAELRIAMTTVVDMRGKGPSA